jgi:MFS family permease
MRRQPTPAPSAKREDIMADHGFTATVTGGRTGQLSAESWTPRLWGILFVLGGALCLDALDVSMVGVALPSIRTAFGLSTASLQWIVSGYVLGYGGLLLLGGRAADLLGRRRMFLLALSVFAVVCCSAGWPAARPC